MPFDLTNALTAFRDLMNRFFWEYLDKFIIIFIDDILIYSRNPEEHEEHLRQELQTLKEHQLCDKFSKCEFLLNKVYVLRHVMVNQGFTKRFSKIAAPLTALTGKRKEVQVYWERRRKFLEVTTPIYNEPYSDLSNQWWTVVVFSDPKKKSRVRRSLKEKWKEA